MIVTCPYCEVRFSVPDGAIGPKGRALRCARCGGRWHADPPGAFAGVPTGNIAEPAPETPPPPPPPPAPPQPGLLPGIDLDTLEDAPPEDGALPPEGKSLLDVTFDASDFDGSAESLETGRDDGETLDDPLSADEPAPIPDLFVSPGAPLRRPARRKGGFGLWLLFLLFVGAGSAAGLYLLQDEVIVRLPQAAKIYEDLGLRTKIVGAGLAFRNIDSERIIQGDSEVLTVRGVIANMTERSRDVPTLHLVLYDGNRIVQEKIVQPPQSSLDGKANIGFVLTLDAPDPHATRFEVTFIAVPADGAASPASSGRK